MKKIFTFFACLFSLSLAQAQMPDGATVQNFTVTDLNGQTYELYDILNEGKSVVIDVFATWCGPCWTYHNQHHLKDVWDMYGPDGTNEIFVMAIEADGATSVDAIYGIGGGTIGDWTVDVPYPIIDDASMGSFLQINYFPTIYMICQDRTIREAGQIDADAMYAFHNQCPEPVGNNNGAIVDYKGYEDHVCDDLGFEPRITFKNFGAEIISDATITASINGSVASTITYSGEMYPFESELMYFDEITIAPGDEISIQIQDINGAPDEDNSDDIYSETVEVPFEVKNNTLNIEVMTDDDGYQIFWAVLRPNRTILKKGGNSFVGLYGGGLQNLPPLGGYDDNELFQETVELPTDGCYKFVIVDNWGDGLQGDGYFKVTDGEGNVIMEGTDFGASVDRTLDVNLSVGTDEITQLESMEVFPNPTSGDLMVNLDLTDKVTNTQLRVVDLTGKAIQVQQLGQLNAGNHAFNISLDNVPTGIYYVELMNESGVFTKKVVKM